MAISPPPLSLYVHIPWCVRKCPYCDFNSHERRGQCDPDDYVRALLRDLRFDLGSMGPEARARPLHSIFIGGGTPSLFSAEAIGNLLRGVSAELDLLVGGEITMEANPGTVERGAFTGYREAGITRLSLGVQSFDSDCLKQLGRIHDPEQAHRAAEEALAAGFDSVNLDLMFGLPGQTLEKAEADLATALALQPPHLSYYQLTLEPNTAFAHNPPELPADDLLWDIQQQGEHQLADAGLTQYEVSAYGRAGHRCRHNLNYWTFGDYLGLGAGAHGKLTTELGSMRYRKMRGPGDYLAAAGSAAAVAGRRALEAEDLLVEFMLNALRLKQGFESALFTQRTDLPLSALEPGLRAGLKRGLLEAGFDQRITPTRQGWLFLNDLVNLFH